MSNPARKKIDKYTIHLDKKLGVGSFGVVYIGVHDETQQYVAIKMLDKKTIDKDEYIKSALFAEIEILKTLKSTNIVGFLDVMESANNYYIVQEYCDGGDLRGYLTKKGNIPEKEAINIITQVCNGFVEILKEGVIHRDLKPENILVNKGIIKICDFGFSKKSNSRNMKNKTMVGTPLYMSIEILKGQPYTSKCDIWALGFIFYELLHGVPPWDASSEYQLIQNIETQALKFPKKLEPLTEDFLSKCLKVRQKDRISWDKLLRHEIFAGYFAHFVKKEHEFENKFKALMGKLRYQINSHDIQLGSLIEKLGFNAQKEMDFTQFDRFMKQIDEQLTTEELRYVFEKLDRDDSSTISLEELETALRQNGIPLKSHYILQKKDSFEEHYDPKVVERRVMDAFVKLSHKLKMRGITLQQVFDAYDINHDGDISLLEFRRIMTRLDNTMSDEDVMMAFRLIDRDSSKTITFDEFETYYKRCTMGSSGEKGKQTS